MKGSPPQQARLALANTSSILLPLAERSFECCVPHERAILEPGRIKFRGSKKGPCLARMFPIQNFESQIHILGYSFECSRLVIYTLWIDPARLCTVFLANQ